MCRPVPMTDEERNKIKELKEQYRSGMEGLRESFQIHKELRHHHDELLFRRRCLAARLVSRIAFQRRDAAYNVDSPYWERWFAFEHKEARRRGVRDVSRGSPPQPLVVREKDQATLAAVLWESEEEEWRKEEEEAYQARMVEAMALSADGDWVVRPLRPPTRDHRLLQASEGFLF